MSSQLQHKLQQFKATPPKDAWSAIEEQLNSTSSELQERLYNFEIPPPSMAWTAIQGSLEKESTTKANNRKSLTQKKWFRYAAAAAILGV
ncbi:MAG TPA: hypothetical protein VD794_10020, partial [Flavisolibacter sp.]|nr:hypothetical protein [Flavisolibacter sp.]